MRKTTIAFWVCFLAVALACDPGHGPEFLPSARGLLFYLFGEPFTFAKFLDIAFHVVWAAFCIALGSYVVIKFVQSCPTGEEIAQAKHDVALRKYRAVRNKIETDLVEGFRKPGTVTAKYEKQPIFETDGYEQIVHRVAEEEALSRGIWNDAQSWSRWNGSQYGEYSKTMFKVDVRSRANSIILERLTKESDRVVHAAVDFVAEEVKQRKSRKRLD
jgi:hypothetical protein